MSFFQSPIISVLHHPSHANLLSEIIKAVIAIQNNALQQIYDAVQTLPKDKRPPLSSLILPRNHKNAQQLEVSTNQFINK